jgi:hypothetical protein
MRFASYILGAAALAVAVSTQSSKAQSSTAQSSTTQIKLFAAATAGPTQASLQGVAGSIIDANAVATTVQIACTSNATDCPFPTPWTVTEGPSSWTMSAVFSTQSYGAEVWMTIAEACQITSSTQASCSNSVGIAVSDGGLTTSTKTVLQTTFPSSEIYYQTLTVTGGLDKLNRPQATQTPTAAAGRMGMGGAAAAAAAVAAVGFL